MQRPQAQSPREQPFQPEQGNTLALLRPVLEAAGYTPAALAATTRGRERSERLDVSLAQRRTVTPTPYHTLVRLFFLGQTVPEEAARSALAPVDPEHLLVSGLLRQTDTGVCATAMLTPAEGILVAHDFPPEITGVPMPADHVLGVGRASLTLANMTVRRQGARVLDLGTGSGVQALLASQHAAQVIGTDVSRRALNFAALNACLNGVANVAWRHGGLYEPVQDEQFDLIVSNPPFVISPASQYVFRDSTLPGDSISEQVIRGAPGLLREGGYCVALCNWHHTQEQDWSVRPRQWVASNGCDAWLLCFGTEDPLSYAAGWLRSAEPQDQAQYGQLLDVWQQYYARLGIERISSGVVILRRRSAQRHWVRTNAFPFDLQAGSGSEQILRIFAAQDVLENLRDAHALLDHRLVLAPDHEMEHVLQVEQGSWQVKQAVLKLNRGLALTGPVDRLVSIIVAGCNGQRVLRDLVTQVAHAMQIDFEVVVPPCLKAIRNLMQSGFLSVVDQSVADRFRECPEMLQG